MELARNYLESINFIFVQIFVILPVDKLLLKTNKWTKTEKKKKPFLGDLNPKILLELSELYNNLGIFVFSISSIHSSYLQKWDFLLFKTHAFVRSLIKKTIECFKERKKMGFAFTYSLATGMLCLPYFSWVTSECRRPECNSCFQEYWFLSFCVWIGLYLLGSSYNFLFTTLVCCWECYFISNLTDLSQIGILCNLAFSRHLKSLKLKEPLKCISSRLTTHKLVCLISVCLYVFLSLSLWWRDLTSFSWQYLY